MASRVKDALKKVNKSKDKLLTPLITEFMATHELFNFDDKAIALATQIMKAERIHRRSDVFHPSGAGACMRAQVLSMNGAQSEKETDLQLENIFDDGKWRHLRWHLMVYRMKISHSIEPFISNKTLRRVGGSPDQVLNLSKPYPWLAGKRVGFEMKGARSSAYQGVVANRRPMVHHLYQICIYMMILGLDLYTIIYENKDTQEWFEFDVALDDTYKDRIEHLLVLDPMWISYLEARYKYMNHAVDKGVLPAHECTMEPDDVQFKRCGFSTVCKESERMTLFKFPNRDRIEVQLFEDIKNKHESRVPNFRRLTIKESHRE